MRKFTTVSTLSLALLLGVTACTGGAPTSDPATTITPAPASAESAPADPNAATEGTAKLGTTWKYDDGTTISVSAPTPGKSTDTATKPGIPISIFVVSITNGTDKPMTPSGFVSVSHGPDGLPSEQVFDSGQGLAQSFSAPILPGKKATIKVAFDVPATTKDMTVSVTPTFEYADALFVK